MLLRVFWFDPLGWSGCGGIMVAVCQAFIVLLGLVVCLLSAWGAIVPVRLIKLVGGVMDLPWGMYFAVIARLLLGLALITAASSSKFPVIFEVVGWLAIVAAAALPLVGRKRIVRLLRWFEQQTPAIIRSWLLFGLVFGAFLVFGALPG